MCYAHNQCYDISCATLYDMAGLGSIPVVRGDMPAIKPLRYDAVLWGMMFAYVLYRIYLIRTAQ